MEVTVYKSSQRFTFEDPRAEDICSVVGFAYDVAERVGQSVYVLAFETDGRQLGEPLADVGLGERGVIRLGRDDAVPRRFEYGGDVVLWMPPEEQWTCDLMGAHWEQRYIWWGLLTDQRERAPVALSIAHLWPRGYRLGNLHALLSTVSRERKLVLLACEGSFIDGKVLPECWNIAFPRLAELTETCDGKLESFDDEAERDGSC